MKIRVDENRCSGHGICESLRPDVFEVGDDGITHVIADELTENMRPELLRAVSECPTQALSLED